MQDKPILGITIGDVNGIGPEVLAKALRGLGAQCFATRDSSHAG